VGALAAEAVLAATWAPKTAAAIAAAGNGSLLVVALLCL